jgi:ribosome maturation protein SDO1
MIFHLAVWATYKQKKGEINMTTFTGDKEHVSFNLAKYKVNGKNFEIVVEPDLAIKFKKSTASNIDIRDILKSEHIFRDAQKGLLAPESELKEVFQTEDELLVAKQIIQKGEIQLTTEYRKGIIDQKKKKIIEIIRMSAIDPRTGLPHPPARIESAMDEKNVRISEFESPEDQVDNVIKIIRPILPISFQTKNISVIIPSEYAPKAYGYIKKSGYLKKEEWQNDGSLLIESDLPAALYGEFVENLSNLTKGNAEIKDI